METYRNNIIIKNMPKEINTTLDIGSSRNDYGAGLFDEFKTTIIGINDADIIQDLNKNQKLPFKDNSFDIVILSQILEHLTNVEEIIKESKRVSKRYILIGLPNELKLDNRIRFLFGKYTEWEGVKGSYYPQGHKHFFIISTIEIFIKRFFGSYAKKYYIFCMSGGRFIPDSIKQFLADTFPSLFAGQVYYLIELKS